MCVLVLTNTQPTKRMPNKLETDDEGTGNTYS